MAHRRGPEADKKSTQEENKVSKLYAFWTEVTFPPSCLQTTYPVLVDDIDDDHQLASMGSERDVGNAAYLNETLEHLGKNARRDVDWSARDSFWR